MKKQETIGNTKHGKYNRSVNEKGEQREYDRR
jgi:hypothetical protein